MVKVDSKSRAVIFQGRLTSPAIPQKRCLGSSYPTPYPLPPLPLSEPRPLPLTRIQLSCVTLPNCCFVVFTNSLINIMTVAHQPAIIGLSVPSYLHMIVSHYRSTDQRAPDLTGRSLPSSATDNRGGGVSVRSSGVWNEAGGSRL